MTNCHHRNRCFKLYQRLLIFVNLKIKSHIVTTFLKKIFLVFLKTEAFLFFPPPLLLSTLFLFSLTNNSKRWVVSTGYFKMLENFLKVPAHTLKPALLSRQRRRRRRRQASLLLHCQFEISKICFQEVGASGSSALSVILQQ